MPGMRPRGRPAASAASPSPRATRTWRYLMWLLVGAAVLVLVTAIQAGRTGRTLELNRGLGLGAATLLLAAMVGIRGARLQARQQAASAVRAARMLLIAQLGGQDDATLERMAGQTGSAADAARMILQGRHLGNPAGHPRSTKSES